MKFKGLQLQDTLIHSRIPFRSLSKQNLLGVLSEGNVLMHDFVIRANFTPERKILRICTCWMLRHGVRIVCIKCNNDHNFVKIYQNLPKFGNLKKIDNLNFPVTWPLMVESRRESKTKNGVYVFNIYLIYTATKYILNTVVLLLYHYFLLESGRKGWLTFLFN